MRTRSKLGLWLLAVGLTVAAGTLATTEAGGKKTAGVWTDPHDKTLPVDFKVQGEYAAEDKARGLAGCQVIALGNGRFQAVVYPGGLPGAGWDGKNRIVLDGKLEGEKATFKAATGARKYLAQKPEEFSATAKFPPVGQQEATATVSGGAMVIEMADGRILALKKTERKSPTLGKKPLEGALVLFDGKNTDEFNRGRIDKETGNLNTDGSDIVTKRKFMNYTVHAEFLLPYRPDARGQGRGNSGFYMVDHYEVQILDSFGLEGKNNECGGIYERKDPTVNMCLPPLQWQTYDIDFTNAVEENGKVVKKSRITVRLNGVVIHDNVEIASKTGGARKDPEGTPGPLRLQGHGNPLQFRNIWILEKK
jgi:hypothetical protein